jgi:hypothetical protein
VSTFEITDRRGSNKPEEAKKAATPIEDLPVPDGGKGGWDHVAYRIVELQIGPPRPNGTVPTCFAGRAAGLRTDGKPFLADYLFEPEWSEGFRWEPKAKKRLDTFLNCDCKNGNPCQMHKMVLPRWADEDLKRVTDASIKAVPVVFEVIDRKDRALQKQREEARLLIPRG